jgi:hypothetical protein
MAKKNVKANKEVVEQPQSDVQPVQKGTGDSADAKATEKQPKGDKKELQVQPEQGSGKQANDERASRLDSENQAAAVVPEGSEIDDQISEMLDEVKERTEKRNKIAADVFSKHSHRDTIYFTNDMIPFFERSDANRHAATLKNNAVITINRK